MSCAFLCFCVLPARALTYQLAGGNASWPADKRAAIVSAMNAAVALYNANGYFPKNLTANYNAGVPTAQGNYSGWIDFGGSISTRVALHEISHTLGVGTYSTWASRNVGGTWNGSRATARVKIFDGSSAVVNCDNVHFWPYGLNYDTEDSTTNRVRHIKMVSALRWDLGIVLDSDSDGMPDDWEQFHFSDLTKTASGDWDADGVTNLAEYQADTHPGTAFSFTWNGGAGAWNTTSASWTGASTLWRNGGNDSATFAGTAGLVTVASGITVNDMVFQTSGYQLGGTSLALTGASPTITVATGASVSLAPILTGTQGLAKSGNGTLTLSAAHTFSGPLTINAGSLVIAPGARLYMAGGAEGMTIKSGATLTFSGDWGWEGTMRYMGVQATENIIDGGTLQHVGASNAKTSIGAGRLFTIGASGATLESATAGAEFSIGYRYDYDDTLGSEGGVLTLTGVGDGDLNYNLSGTGALIKRGSGLWKLTGAGNQYSGGTTIGVNTASGTVGGVLRIQDNSSLGTGPITVIAGDLAGTHMGAQLQLTGGITLTNPSITISGLGFGSANGVILNLSGNNTMTGSVILGSGAGGSVIASDAGTLTIGAAGISANYVSRTLEFTGAGNVVVPGVIANGATVALPLTKSGSGMLTLTGSNTYSGTTTIEQGVMQIGANSANGSLGTGAIINDATLRFHRSDTALLVPNVISGSGVLEVGVSSGGNVAAETTLSGANTFTGNVVVNSGGLRIRRSDALGTTAKSVTMTNGTTGNCRLILDGGSSGIQLPAAIGFVTSNTNTTNPAFINESGNNTIAGNMLITNGGGSTRVRVDAGSLTLTGQVTPAVSGRTLQLDGVGSGVFSGALKNGSNTVALEKFGSGTWSLLGNGHTYTGTTTVYAGKLILGANLTSSSLSVNAGSLSLLGQASTSGAINVQSGATFEVRPSSDSLSVAGSVTLAGSLEVIASSGLSAGASFRIINKTSAGSISGTFTDKPQGSVFFSNGYLWQISYSGGDGNDVTLTIATALQSWRHTHFGSIANTGMGADTFDADQDGESNLLEFATAQNPHNHSIAAISCIKNGTTLEYQYPRSKSAVADGIQFTVKWSETLVDSSWSSANVTESLLADFPEKQTIKATMPAGVAQRRFVRLHVVAP